jgi:hypothetical protein
MNESRDAAVAVYRWLRAVHKEGGATLPEIAFQCFSLPSALGDPEVDLPPAVVARLRRVPVTRTLEAIVWLRAQGVVIRAVPDVSGLGLTRYVIEAP